MKLLYAGQMMKQKIGTVSLSGKLVCASHQEVEVVRKYLPEHIRLTKAEPGCLSFEVVQTNDPLVWQVEECFTNQEAFEHHQQRTRNSDWWKETSKIKRDYEIK